MYILVGVILLGMVSLSGCAVSVSERWDIVHICEQDIEADCTAEWDAYNRGVDAQEERRKRNNTGCRSGYYLYCNHVCNATKRHGEVAGVCVSNKEWGF